MDSKFRSKLEKAQGKNSTAINDDNRSDFRGIQDNKDNYNLLFQLPTGGGKTVIFSELAKQYILAKGKKVLILTHRIELLGQTSNLLSEIGVTNKVINAKVKDLDDGENHWCYVAMVETLNNRINEEAMEFEDLGLVIVDEAHYNSFRKLFKHFNEQALRGVTATPLGSNIGFSSR